MAWSFNFACTYFREAIGQGYSARLSGVYKRSGSVLSAQVLSSAKSRNRSWAVPLAGTGAFWFIVVQGPVLSLVYIPLPVSTEALRTLSSTMGIKRLISKLKRSIVVPSSLPAPMPQTAEPQGRQMGPAADQVSLEADPAPFVPEHSPNGDDPIIAQLMSEIGEMVIVNYKYIGMYGFEMHLEQQT